TVPDDSLCNDQNVCTNDVCLPSGDCDYTNNNLPCSDGSSCTTHDQCVAGQCTGTGTLCGDGVVETECGETCHPGNPEICTNANGIIYTAEVKATDLGASGGKRWFYRAPDGAPLESEGGIAKLSVRRRVDRGVVGFGIRVTAYGDFSAATLPVMTTQVYFGD